MLTIKRLGRRSFEVFRLGVPVGIVRFLKEAKVWSFRPYPTPDASSGLVESQIRYFVIYSVQRVSVVPSIERFKSRIDLARPLRHTIATFDVGALVRVAFRQVQ